MSTWDLAAYPYAPQPATTTFAERNERYIKEHYRHLRGHLPPTTEEILAYWRTQDYQRSMSRTAPSCQAIARPLDRERDVACRDEPTSINPSRDLPAPMPFSPFRSGASLCSDGEICCSSPTLREGVQPGTPRTLPTASSRPPSPSPYKGLQTPILPLSHPSIAALWPSHDGPTGCTKNRWLRTSAAFAQHGTLTTGFSMHSNGPVREEGLNTASNKSEGASVEQLDAMLLPDAPRLLGSLMDVIFEDSCPPGVENVKTVVQSTVPDFLDKEDTPVVPNLWCLEQTNVLASPQI